jgi:hypothetical protein
MLMEVRRLKENKRFTFWVTPATSLGLGKPSEMLDVTVSNKGMFFSHSGIYKCFLITSL